jgi:hypothetical protein
MEGNTCSTCFRGENSEEICRNEPQGVHAAIWSEMIDYDFHLPNGKTRTLASYSCGAVTRAFVEAVLVGDALPEMPLFLKAESYVQVPLETTYQLAFDEVPMPWRDVLARPIESELTWSLVSRTSNE